jgi:hypothetical protein
MGRARQFVLQNENYTSSQNRLSKQDNRNAPSGKQQIMLRRTIVLPTFVFGSDKWRLWVRKRHLSRGRRVSDFIH